jgi:hypothetical protein
MSDEITDELIDNKEYEERADFIDDKDLLNWTVESDLSRNIQGKILGRGAKLIVGPRGTGKTHQFKLAYNKCLHETKMPLAIYVTFGKYYHLEPFLFKAPHAIRIFHTWVLSKILLGCYQLLSDMGNEFKILEEDSPTMSKERLEEFVSHAEKGYLSEADNEVMATVSIYKVTTLLEHLASILSRKRIVLLLDDAALTFTPDYMVEFFDIFRSLRTNIIAPKASVYPGTTEYGPRFHVGHDAEEVNAWLNIENSDYSSFMDEIIQKRFHTVKEDISRDIIELLKYASFGVPRTFINLLRDYVQSRGKTAQQKFNIVINEQAHLILDLYFIFKEKMPQYKLIIGVGHELFEKIVKIITDENKKLQKEKQVEIGIFKEQSLKFDRMFKLLIEAGLLYELDPVSHGGRERKYRRYVPHLLFLIQDRAFSSTSRGFNPKEEVNFIKRKSAKHAVRRSFSTLLSEEQIGNIRLDSPPCTHCKATRLSEHQKFCHNCGRELVEESNFKACMEITIDQLPIPSLQKERIKQEGLQTVGDILSISDPARALQKAKHIGRKRAENIYKKAKAAVDEFLT